MKPPGNARQAREALGLSRRQFADKLGVNATTVYRWEAHRVKPIPILRRAIRGLLSDEGPKRRPFGDADGG